MRRVKVGKPRKCQGEHGCRFPYEPWSNDGLLPGRQHTGSSVSLYPPQGGSEKLLLLNVLVTLAVQTDWMLCPLGMELLQEMVEGALY